MSQGLSGKSVEVVLLVLAGIGFGIWQLREVNRELERARAERLAREARERAEAGKADAGSAEATQEPLRER